MASVTSATELDRQYKENQNNLYDKAQDIARRPYQAYTGPKVAGFNADQQAVMGDIRNMYESAQAYDPRAALARSYNAGPTMVNQRSFLSGNVQDYMNPYVDQVIDRTFRQVDRATDARQQRIRDDAIAKKAFGNDRRFVMEGVAEAEGEFQKANLASNLYNQAFTAGANLMNQDINRATAIDQGNQGYMNQYNQLLAQNAVLGLTDQNQARQAFAGVGDAQRDFTQRGMDEAQAEFFRAQGYDEKQIRMLADILYGQTAETTVTETTSGVKGPSRVQSALGGAAAGYSIGGPPGAAIGAILGGFF